MAKPKRFNPFYFVLLVGGVIFVITTFAYTVLTTRGVVAGEIVASQAASPAAGDWLMELLDRHGFLMLTVELAVLAFAAFAAMLTDSYWEPPVDGRADSGPATAARPPNQPAAGQLARAEPGSGATNEV